MLSGVQVKLDGSSIWRVHPESMGPDKLNAALTTNCILVNEALQSQSHWCKF